jgi:hypothetical protein
MPNVILKKRRTGLMGNKGTRKATWARNTQVMERYMSSAFHQMGKEGMLTSAHNLGHIQRVATYAQAYVSAMGGGKKKQAMAKISGLGHDRFRDAADSLKQAAEKQKTHEERAAEHFKPMLEKRFTKKVSSQMVQAMGKHGTLPKLNEVGKNIVRDAVVFADKFFEANGSYIAFRRAMFMGERADWRKVALERNVFNNPEEMKKLAVESTLKESEKRVAAFSDLSKIPTSMHKFVNYQVQWQHKLVEALKVGDKGMTNLVTVLFAEGLKEKPRDLTEMIKLYKPVAETDRAFKEETMRYLNGELAEKFKQLVSQK